MNGELDDLERNRREAAAAHARLVAHLATLTDAQAAQPSLLPGWSIGHVLTHLARNADSHVGVLQAANEGRAAAQYPGGLEQRNADIEAGQGRPAAALVADVIESNGRLEAAWSAMTADGWRGEGLSVFGPVAVADLPFRRWRCLLYTSDAADDLLCVDLSGRSIIKKKNDTVSVHARQKT